MNTKAKWICSAENWDEACLEFYRNIKINGKIKRAILSVSAVGLYCPFINGTRIGNELYTPYFTAYDKRTQFQSYDVTEYLNDDNELCILASEGWAIGNLVAIQGFHHRYAEKISVIFSLEVVKEDGEVDVFLSDTDVKVRTSRVLSSSIYNGEHIDMTATPRELGNALLSEVFTTLVPQEGEKVLERETLYPVKLIITPKGERVIDFGQNMVGYVKVTANGKRGDKIALSHAEILDKNGNFYTENLRSAKAQISYVLSGDGTETFKPTFTWQGFRFVRIDEYPTDEISLCDFEGIVVYSNIRRSSVFSCGNQKINQLYSNIIWGQKGNFIDIPTDCPQRDERIGWTGDAQIFARAAAINFDVERFFRKWLRDLALEQYEDGLVGQYIPTCRLQHACRAIAAWGDAATICPWEIYLAYGNKELLLELFPTMKKWVDFVHGAGSEEFLWIGGAVYGDWLALDDEEAIAELKPTKGKTDHDYIASAFFAYSTSLLIRAGHVLGINVSEYETLLQNVKNAIKQRYFEDGVPAYRSQTAYALALRFDLCEEKDKKRAGEILAELVRANGNRLTTGFVATAHLLHALSESGQAKTAYDLLLQEKFPSWLYSVNKGATTIWEHWDGILEDGNIWSAKMNSFNHYSYGSVCDWLFGAVAGIKCLDDGAGYRHVSIAPQPDSRLGFVNYSIDTRAGKIQSGWRYLEDGTVRYEIEIPCDTKGEICLPDGRKYTLNGGIYTFYTET